MLRPGGEVHVSHKTTGPFIAWNIEDLASRSSLALIQRVAFNISDYPGYQNKRGDGTRSDEPFRLGKCSTFKFILSKKPNCTLIQPHKDHGFRIQSHTHGNHMFKVRLGFAAGLTNWINRKRELLRLRKSRISEPWILESNSWS